MSKANIYKMKKSLNGFSFTFEHDLEPFEEVIIDMPSVSSNKRGVNDIGWVSDGEVVLYGTLSDRFDEPDTLWQQIIERDEINKTVSALKAVNGGTSCRIIIRAILN